MAPILGIWASQNYSRYSITGSYDSIATVTVGSGGSSSVTFSSIPATYAHLQLRIFVKGSTSTYGFMRFNSDSNANYFTHDLVGTGSAVNAYAFTSINQIYWFPSNYSGTASTFSPCIIDILDYANTNKNKTTRSLQGYDTNGGGIIEFSSGAWNNTAAVTTISLTPNTGTFSEYSHFALYGIKGA